MMPQHARKGIAVSISIFESNSQSSGYIEELIIMVDKDTAPGSYYIQKYALGWENFVEVVVLPAL